MLVYTALQVLIGLQVAYEMNATFVLDSTALQSEGDHGTYPWFDEMTGISHHEYTLERAIAEYNPRIIDVCPTSAASTSTAMQQCNLLFNITSYECCSYLHSVIEHHTKHDCFTFECHKGLFSTFRPLMLQKYKYAQLNTSLNTLACKSSLVFNTAEYNVAVHIRTGDVKLHVGNVDYFINMIQSTVRTHLSHMPVHIYYIGQFGVSDNTHAMTESPTEDWSFLNTLHVNTSFYNPDEQTALHHFIHADMTIITGSSFPYIAIALSDKPVYVTAISKTGVHDFLYDPGSSYSFDLDEHGRLEACQAEAFQRAIQDKRDDA
jgi:hypothetical protein